MGFQGPVIPKTDLMWS